MISRAYSLIKHFHGSASETPGTEGGSHPESLTRYILSLHKKPWSGADYVPKSSRGPAQTEINRTQPLPSRSSQSRSEGMKPLQHIELQRVSTEGCGKREKGHLNWLVRMEVKETSSKRQRELVLRVEVSQTNMAERGGPSRGEER